MKNPIWQHVVSGATVLGVCLTIFVTFFPPLIRTEARAALQPSLDEKASKESVTSIDRRLERIEEKIDRLLENRKEKTSK